jgi:uncharacterized membrane protein
MSLNRIAAGLIIEIIAVIALIAFSKILKKSTEEQTEDKETIGLYLASGMVLGWNFEEVVAIFQEHPQLNQEHELSILAIVAAATTIVLSWSLSKEIDRYNVDIVQKDDNSYGTDCRNNKVTMTKQ